MNRTIVPNIEWYVAKSAAVKATPRCLYASASRCPRYFSSLSLMGQAGATGIEPAEHDRLLAKWKKTDLWPNTAEQDTAIMGTESSRMYANFCPEVAFDIFGYFASSFGDYTDAIDRDFVHRKLRDIDPDRRDWRWRWSFLTPAHYSECRLYSLLKLRAEQEMDEQKRAYIARRLATTTERVVEKCMIGVSEAMAEATRQKALGDSRVWLVYNKAIQDTIVSAIPDVVRFVYDAADGNTSDASGVLEAALSNLNEAAVAKFEKRTRTGARAFGMEPLYGQLRQTLAALKDGVIDDFNHGFLEGKRLTKSTSSGISVNVTGSPGAQVAAGTNISQSMSVNAKVLVDAIDDVLVSDAFAQLESDKQEFVRGFADLIKEEIKKSGDVSKIKTWTERIKFALETAKLAVEASKIGGALITFLSSMG